jgi:hypothetical protein
LFSPVSSDSVAEVRAKVLTLVLDRTKDAQKEQQRATGFIRDPDAVAADLAQIEAAAWPVFAAAHIPMIGEWVALPVLRSAGATILDPLAERVKSATAERLLEHCPAVPRLPGTSVGTGHDVPIAHSRGLPVYYRVEELPVRLGRSA